jgi:hypothetical protein
MAKYLIVMLVLSSYGIASADESGWTRQDTYRHAALTMVMAVDYLQTVEISRNPDHYYERNPILGRHPSVAEVSAYFALSYVVVTAVAYAMPDDWRPWFQYAVIGVESAAVGNNLYLGIGLGF